MSGNPPAWKAQTDLRVSDSVRSMQGQSSDAKKHSLDSDEEDEVENRRNYELLNDDDIEGQEDDTLKRDGEIQITPFNLKEERQEGEFSADGDFIWKKDKDEIKDSWLDNIDWVKVEEQTDKQKRKREEDDEKEDLEESEYNELETYKKMLDLMKPGESVAKALRRLGGNKKPMSASQRWKKKKTGEEDKDKEGREKMLKLTGFADAILTRSGNMEIYEETFEKIQYKLSHSKTSIPEDVDDDDALDMFAEAADGKKAPEAAAPKVPEEKVTSALDTVQWEFRWENEDGAEVHGPHDSETMLKWQESGFFDKGVFVRKVGTQGEFNSSKRIDFELYV